MSRCYRIPVEKLFHERNIEVLECPRSDITKYQNLSIITRDQNATGEKCHMIDITGTEILPVTEMSRDIIFRSLTPLKDIFHG